jgi:succinate-semialdehyde dehydrogenase/glutarate-semialdehyde dehydrogenase
MHNINCMSPNDQQLLASVPITPLSPLMDWVNDSTERIVPVDERIGLLHALSTALIHNSARLERAIIDEVGKTATEAAGEVPYAAAFIDAACSVLENEGETETEVKQTYSKISQAPLGTALLITAYNDPVAGIIRKIAPAIAAGCPVVIKPSPLGAWCAQILQEILPDGFADYVQFAYLDDNASTAALVRASGIGVVSLTGSTKAGRTVGTIAGARPIPCTLELGGNCPFVVFADADLDCAAFDILDRKARSAGQACSALNRVLVDARVIKPLLERIIALLDNFTCGPSTHPEARFGPVRTQLSRTRLSELEGRCVAMGGVVVGRGKDLALSDACSTYPLTIVRTNQTSPLDLEEAFGPLFSVRAYSDLAQLDQLLAPARQNLAAYFYGSQADAYLGSRLSIRFGSIGINTTRVQGADVPTGGFGQAGHGREGGVWGLNAFRSTINVKRAT